VEDAGIKKARFTEAGIFLVHHGLAGSNPEKKKAVKKS
jgi:hypothetical protein